MKRSKRNAWIGIIVILIACFVILGVEFPFALSTGGARGVTWVEFDSGIIDTARINIAPGCSSEGNELRIVDGRLKSRCSPQTWERPVNVQGLGGGIFDLPRASDWYNADLIGRVSQNVEVFKSRKAVSGTQADVIHFNKDFWGQDIRMPIMTARDSMAISYGDFEHGNFITLDFFARSISAVPSTDTMSSVSGLFEVIVDPTTPTLHEVFWNDESVIVLDIPSSNRVSLSVGNQGGDGVFIDRVNFEPPFGCTVLPGELLVKESFAGGQSIDLFSTRYPVMRFCEQNPVILVDQESQGSDTSLKPYKRLVAGEQVDIPSNQVWEVSYIMRNVDAEGNSIFGFTCAGNELLNLITGECEPQIGIVQVCSEGTYDPERHLCITEPELGCPGGVIENGKCTVYLPVEQVCEEGTFNEDTGECMAAWNECPLGYSRIELGDGEFRCDSELSPTTLKALQPVTDSARYFKGLIGLDVSLISILVLFLAFISVLFIWWRYIK